MNREGAIHTLAALAAAAAALAVAVAVAPTPPSRPVAAEISPEQYGLLASSTTLATERLETVRAMLQEDGIVDVEEFAALGIEAGEASPRDAKQRLLQRLLPKTVEGTRLHPSEDDRGSLTAFQAEVCTTATARTSTAAVQVGAGRYELRDFHFCGQGRVSGFTVYRDGLLVSTVRHFGHVTAESFDREDWPCVLRRDLSSGAAYRLLVDFYDGQISDDDFVRAIVRAV